MKGVQHQVQGEQLRVTGKKRDDLQAVIAKLKEERLRHPPPVRELPRLRPAVPGLRSRRRATRSAVGGWVVNRLANFALRPVSGLTM